MAGGQERILRRRIQIGAVDEEDHARDGADRGEPDREGASARAGRGAVRRTASPTSSRNLQAAGGGANHPMLVDARRDPHASRSSSSTADRGLCGGVQPSVIRAAEAEIREHARLGSRVRARRRRPQGRGLLPVPQLPTSPACTRASRDNPTLRGRTRDRGAAASSAFEAGELDLVQLVYTRFISAGRQEVVVRPLLPLDSDEDLDAGRASAERPAGGYEFEPEPGRDPRRAAAALRRGARLRRVAERGRVGARGPPARDEGRDRQRRRADPRPDAASMNRARQDSITTEIMEIVGGAEALRSAAAIARRHRTTPTTSTQSA